MDRVIDNLASFQLDPVRGFLPAQDPLERLPGDFEVWEQTAADVPALLMTGRLRAALDCLPAPDAGRLEDEASLRRALLLLTTFGNAYVWAEDEPAARIPQAVAGPLCRVADRLGLPPIATYASTVLANWRRLDKHAPVALGNLAALQIFAGGIDEHWFYVSSVAIEAEGAPALQAFVDAQRAAEQGRDADLITALGGVARALAGVNAVLDRIPERCDPHMFFHRVRPYLTGWPQPGVVYEGVGVEARMLAGGSAAQSPLIQSLDAALGIRHEAAEVGPYLADMRRYMLPAHRRFLEALEAGPSVRQHVLDRASQSPALVGAYNACVEALDRFRRKHMELAVRYIAHQAPSPEQARGTGGTSFVSFLGKARKATAAHRIEV